MSIAQVGPLGEDGGGDGDRRVFPDHPSLILHAARDVLGSCLSQHRLAACSVLAAVACLCGLHWCRALV